MSFSGILSLSHPRASIARPGDLLDCRVKPDNDKKENKHGNGNKKKKAKTLETELAEISAIKYPRQAAFEFFAFGCVCLPPPDNSALNENQKQNTQSDYGAEIDKKRRQQAYEQKNINAQRQPVIKLMAAAARRIA